MCGPQLADVETLYQRFRSSEFVLLAVNRRETEGVIREFTEKAGISFPVLMDMEGAVYDLYKGGGFESPAPFPRDVVIDKNGKILYFNKIYHPNSLEAAIRAGLEDTGAGQPLTKNPDHFELYQNYPNPFNPCTALRYRISERSEIRLKVIDLRGRTVRILFIGTRERGEYESLWDGKDDSGVPVAGGVYLFRLESDGFFRTGKMVLIK